jgi:hypothetical protein
MLKETTSRCNTKVKQMEIPVTNPHEIFTLGDYNAGPNNLQRPCLEPRFATTRCSISSAGIGSVVHFQFFFSLMGGRENHGHREKFGGIFLILAVERPGIR